MSRSHTPEARARMSEASKRAWADDFLDVALKRRMERAA